MNNDNNLENFIISSIKTGIAKEVEKIFEKKKTEMVKELEEDKNKIIAKIVVEIMQESSFEHLRDNLIITIRKEQKNAN